MFKWTFPVVHVRELSKLSKLPLIINVQTWTVASVGGAKNQLLEALLVGWRLGVGYKNGMALWLFGKDE